MSTNIAARDLVAGDFVVTAPGYAAGLPQFVSQQQVVASQTLGHVLEELRKIVGHEGEQ